MKSIKLLSVLLLFFSLINDVNAQSPNCLWANFAGGIGQDQANAIATDANGNVIVTGGFTSPSFLIGTTTLTSAGYEDLFIVKYDSLGNVLWANSAGGVDLDEGIDITTDNSGNILLTGIFFGPTISFGTTTLTSAATGSADIFIVKYDPMGNVIWAKSAGGTGYDQAQSISTDNLGNVVIAGFFKSPTITFGTATFNNSGEFDMFVAKYDPFGNLLWAHSAGGSFDEHGMGVTCDPNGNIIVAGTYISPSLTFGTAILTNNGGRDLFVVKYDPIGNVLWTKSEGGTNEETCDGIASDANGNVLLTGYFQGTSITFGTITLNSLGGPDIYVVKYDDLGNVLWAHSAVGTSVDFSIDINVDLSGSVIITGYYFSDSLSFGHISLINASVGINPDIFVAKYDASGNVIMAASFGGAYEERGLGVCTDFNGNILMTGSFTSTVLTFGTCDLSNALVGGTDFYVVKIQEWLTGLPEVSNQEYFYLYPNPFSEKLIIQLTTPLNKATLTVINQLGQVVNVIHNLSGTSLTISRENIESGLYMFQLSEGTEKMITGKLIIAD